MKTIGLLGGMSWESTAEYYRVVNTTVKEKLGGLHSAKILMYSVDFAHLARLMSMGGWDRIEAVLSCAARTLEEAGADFIVMGTNTMHKMAAEIEASISIPLFHIADAAADEIQEKALSRVALLGTRPTMEMDFYKTRLAERGLKVLTPPEEDRAELDRIIFDELCQGRVEQSSKRNALKMIDNLKVQGAEGAILGCTELGLMINQADTDLPLFDTTIIHARRAALLALN